MFNVTTYNIDDIYQGQWSSQIRLVNKKMSLSKTGLDEKKENNEINDEKKEKDEIEKINQLLEETHNLCSIYKHLGNAKKILKDHTNRLNLGDIFEIKVSKDLKPYIHIILERNDIVGSYYEIDGMMHIKGKINQSLLDDIKKEKKKEGKKIDKETVSEIKVEADDENHLVYKLRYPNATSEQSREILLSLKKIFPNTCILPIWERDNNKEETLTFDIQTQKDVKTDEIWGNLNKLNDRFESIKKLGDGGMGEVYEAHINNSSKTYNKLMIDDFISFLDTKKNLNDINIIGIYNSSNNTKIKYADLKITKTKDGEYKLLAIQQRYDDKTEKMQSVCIGSINLNKLVNKYSIAFSIDRSPKDKKIALKISKERKDKKMTFNNTDDSKDKNLFRESRLMGKIDSENVVKHFYMKREYRSTDINRTRGFINSMIIEYIKGQNLDVYFLRKKKIAEIKNSNSILTSEEYFDIAKQLLYALIDIHKAGIIHRDIKLSNFIRSNEGKIKLSDFGISIDKEEIMYPGPIEGCPFNICPEEILLKKGNKPFRLTEQSDIYSLGLILFELYTGNKAFDASIENDKMRRQPVKLRILNKQVKNQPKLPDNMPKDLKKLISTMLKKKPEDRKLLINNVEIPLTAENVLKIIKKIEEQEKKDKQIIQKREINTKKRLNPNKNNQLATNITPRPNNNTISPREKIELPKIKSFSKDLAENTQNNNIEQQKSLATKLSGINNLFITNTDLKPKNRLESSLELLRNLYKKYIVDSINNIFKSKKEQKKRKYISARLPKSSINKSINVEEDIAFLKAFIRKEKKISASNFHLYNR